MGLIDFIHKQFIDILQWSDEEGGVLAWSYPMEDSEIQYGASLTVRPSQLAVFVNEGKVADVFAPGMYRLTTQTIPVLTYLKNWDKLFASPFKSELYFFKRSLQLDRKWGTTQAITIRDKDFGMVRLRAFGNYSFQIVDASRFYSEVSGSQAVYTVDALDGQLRSLVQAGIADMVGNADIPFLDLAANQAEFSAKLRENLLPKFARLGLALDSLQVLSMSLPEGLQTILDQRIGLNMVGDLGQFVQYQTAQAIPVAAANPGGVTASAAQMGVGLAIGQAMAAGSMPAAIAPVVAEPAAPSPTPQDLIATLEKLHDLKIKGVLSEAEFGLKKAELLKKLR